jgi:serine/threonine-protein kinase RsbW
VTETPELQLALPARAENVIVVRQVVAGLGEALGLPDQRVDDLKTVVTEACNNVVVHAYAGEAGPMIVTAASGESEVEVTISDHGRGFQPRAGNGEASLGLGLPLIAALSDGFQIRGGAGGGTSTSVRFDLVDPGPVSPNGDVSLLKEELEMEIAPGALVRPVLARVIGALAARAEFSFERLSDTVLLGDAVSSHEPGDFSKGRVEVTIRDSEGNLEVRVGPLVKGGGERILAEMEIPEGGSLRGLASRMEVVEAETAEGSASEFLVFEVQA